MLREGSAALGEVAAQVIAGKGHTWAGCSPLCLRAEMSPGSFPTDFPVGWASLPFCQLLGLPRSSHSGLGLLGLLRGRRRFHGPGRRTDAFRPCLSGVSSEALLREAWGRGRMAEKAKGGGVWCQGGRCCRPRGSGLKASLLTTSLQRLLLTCVAPKVGGVLMLGGYL